MQTIMYAGGSFLTGNEIAGALLEFSRALGQEREARIVEIPIRDDDGSEGVAKFLIGPASQIVVKSARSDGDELIAPAVVAQLRAWTRGTDFPEGAQTDGSSNGISPDEM